MAQPIAPDYGQQFLFPPALEDWVAVDHPARFLREFVDQLDLAALGFALPVAVEGRPPYHPSLLLKIWLYGYYHRIRSTRKLEVACCEHLSLLWLTGLIQPDHNALWRFWRNNKKALRAIFKQTVQVAVHTGAVGLALQALDGTKIEAACSGPHGWRQDYMAKLLAQLDAALDDLELKVVAENAEVESPGYRLPASLAERQALREQIQTGLAQLQADGRKSYHPVEPEARRMKVGDTNRYAYNAQAVADAKEGVLVACDATRQETDHGQLVPLIQQACENLGVAAQDTVTLADTGYGAGADLQAAAQHGMAVLVPPAEGTPARDNPYATQHFHYDPTQQQGDLSAKPDARSRRAHHQRRRARRTLPLSPPRLPRAHPLHARPQRPATRSASAHCGGASHAPTVGRPNPPGAMATAQHDHRTALWPAQTTRRLSALDRVGTGRREDPVVATVRDAKLARALSPLAVAPRTRSNEPASTGDPVGKGTEVGRSTPARLRPLVGECVQPESRTERSSAKLAPGGLRSSAMNNLSRQSQSSERRRIVIQSGAQRTDAPYHQKDFRMISGRPLRVIKHSITRYRITLEAWAAKTKNGKTQAGNWLTPKQLHKLAFTSAHKKILAALG